MSNSEANAMLEDIIKPFSSMLDRDRVSLSIRDYSEVSVSKAVNDRILELISKEEITATEIALLSALTQYRSSKL